MLKNVQTITRQLVTEKLLAYLNGAITLSELVDWAENCFVTGGFAHDEDIDLLADIVIYLAGADRPYFPLTWEAVSDFLNRLDDEQRWQQSFGQSADLLERLADQALADHRAGKTEELNLDNL